MKALLLAMTIVANCIAADDSQAIETAAREYFTAYAEQRWEDHVDLMHPKHVQQLRDAVLAIFPKSEAEIKEKDRKPMEALLKVYGVATVEEVFDLSAKQIVLGMFKERGETPAMKVMKEAKTTIENITVRETREGGVADISAVSILRGKEFRAITQIEIAKADGRYLVAGMTRTKLPGKD